MYGIGLILGAGIYVLIGDVAAISGNAMCDFIPVGCSNGVVYGVKTMPIILRLSKERRRICLCERKFWEQFSCFLLLAVSQYL